MQLTTNAEHIVDQWVRYASMHGMDQSTAAREAIKLATPETLEYLEAAYSRAVFRKGTGGYSTVDLDGKQLGDAWPSPRTPRCVIYILVCVRLAFPLTKLQQS